MKPCVSPGTFWLWPARSPIVKMAHFPVCIEQQILGFRVGEAYCHISKLAMTRILIEYTSISALIKIIIFPSTFSSPRYAYGLLLAVKYWRLLLPDNKLSLYPLLFAFAISMTQIINRTAQIWPKTFLVLAPYAVMGCQASWLFLSDSQSWSELVGKQEQDS